MTPHAQGVEARILEAARAEVLKFGAKRATVVGVAERLGMSHANVYRHFASKAALLDAVTAAWLRPLEVRLHEVAEGADPADDKLERALIALHGAYRRTLDAEPQVFDLLVDAFEKGRPAAKHHRARVQAEVQPERDPLRPGTTWASRSWRRSWRSSSLRACSSPWSGERRSGFAASARSSIIRRP